MKHVPVLLNKVLEILSPESNKFIIDGTVDGGGHAVEIIKRLSHNGVFLGIDLDKSMLVEAKLRVAPFTNGVKVILANGNYADLPEILKNKKLGKADGLLLDLGFSSEQLENSGKGFSFLKNEPLDMRYNTDLRGPDANQYGKGQNKLALSQCKSTSMTAAEIINSFREQELADIFWRYGEERISRRIAKKVVETRKRKRILTTHDLVEVVNSAVPGNYERGRIHSATRIFQALRIYVNRELENLEEILKNLPSILKPNGVVVIISFHSLEDRLVKNYFKEMGRKGLANVLTKKPITPEKKEVAANPRSRSAKLRAAFIKIPKF